MQIRAYQPGRRDIIAAELNRTASCDVASRPERFNEISDTARGLGLWPDVKTGLTREPVKWLLNRWPCISYDVEMSFNLPSGFA